MMKKSLLSLILLVGISLNAQVIPNASYTDCNQVTKDIYSVLAQGKVLFITLKGLDCSICKSHAADFQNFAASNSANMEAWGAMIWAYQNKTASCSDLSSWVSTYSWSDVFTFADVNKDFLTTGVPRYLVINPSDSTIVYDGGNITQAKNAASQLMASIGLEEEKLGSTIKIYQNNNVIHIDGLPDGDEFNVTLFNLVGQEQLSWNGLSENHSELWVDSYLNSGVYLIQIQIGDEVVVKKFSWQNN